MSVIRRGLLTGVGSIIAAPAIVRACNLMPVRNLVTPIVFTIPSSVFTIPSLIIERWVIEDWATMDRWRALLSRAAS